MPYIVNTKYNRRLWALVPLGLLMSIAIGMLRPAPTYAACADDSVSCISVQFGQPVGERVIDPSSSIYSATQFYLPVAINIEHTIGYTVDYTVKVYGSGNVLRNITDDTSYIPSVAQNTSYNDLGKNGSEWGIRWNLDDTVVDSHADYRPIPASEDDPSAIVVADEKIDKSSVNVTKQLTLGFAVAADGDLPSGSYANTVTVAVVATPKDVRTLFDILTMQEMSTEICANTTTPNVMIPSTGLDINATASGASYTTAIDTNGSRQGNASYVPQKELTDIRDGKKYTVRKLADGNCWMVSNLEFDFVSAAGVYSTTGTDTLSGSQLVLTNKDTDLNSVREWTPAIAAESYGEAGTVYRTQKVSGIQWGEGLRSFSSPAAYPSARYSAKVAISPNLSFDVANTGSPWQKFGNLYNWTAATLGSGAKVVFDESDGGDTVAQDAVDSVCPRGWKLPSNLDTSNDSFVGLFGKYGLPTATATGGTNISRVANFPLNFLRTGYYLESNGEIRYRMQASSWASATSASSAQTQTVYMDTASFYPVITFPRGRGVSIRCVAR